MCSLLLSAGNHVDNLFYKASDELIVDLISFKLPYSFLLVHSLCILFFLQ